MANLTSLTLNEALTEAARWLTASECQKAIDRCEDLLSAYPDAVRVLNIRARALQACGEIARASQDYARVLEITPADAQAMTGLMQCQLRLGRVNDAAITAALLLDYDPANRDAARLVARAGVRSLGEPGRVLSAKTKYASGLTHRAIGELRAMLEMTTDRPDLQAVLAELTWRDNQRIATTELCQNLLDTQPDCLNAHAVLYALWTRFGVNSLAQEHLAALERFDPDHRETCDWLGGVSPLGVHDVPAQPPPEPPAKPKIADEEERERAEWVDQLAASSVPIAPIQTTTTTTTAMPISATIAGAAVMAAAAATAVDVDDEGEINPAAPPIEWTLADAGDTDAARGADSSQEPLPPWLVNLQEQAEAAATPPAADGAVATMPAPAIPEGIAPAMDEGSAAGPSVTGAVAAGAIAGAVAEAVATTEPATVKAQPVPAEAAPVAAPVADEGAAAKLSHPGAIAAGVTAGAAAVAKAVTEKSTTEKSATEKSATEKTATTPAADEGAAAGASPPSAVAAGAVAGAIATANTATEQAVAGAEAGAGETASGAGSEVVSDMETATGVMAEPSGEGAGGAAAAEKAAPFAPLEWAPAEVEVEGAPMAVGAGGALAGAAAANAKSKEAVPPVVKPVKRAKVKHKRQDLLLLARRSMQTADYNQAADHYARLVKSGEQLDDLKADLDVATHAYPDVPQFHALLGQVYARQGNAKAALDAYRRAMELKS